MAKWFFPSIKGKFQLFKGIGQIFRHGLNAPFIEKILESSALSNFVKGTTGSGLTAAETEQNTWNAEEAQKSRDWTEQMDNTKYQRQTQDMQAAGLNPAMMYGGSVSASGVTGAHASGGDAGSPSSGLLDSILNVMFAKQRLSNLKAEERNIESQTNKNDADADLSRSNRALADRNVTLADYAIEYYPRLTEQKMRQVESAIDDAYAGIDVKVASAENLRADTALKNAQEFLENLKAEWYPRLSAAQESSTKAAAAHDYAMAAMQKYIKQFADSHNGQVPGYSPILGLATAIEGVLSDLGFGEHDVKWSDIKEGIKNYFKEYGSTGSNR